MAELRCILAPHQLGAGAQYQRAGFQRARSQRGPISAVQNQRVMVSEAGGQVLAGPLPVLAG